MLLLCPPFKDGGASSPASSLVQVEDRFIDVKPQF